jgi:tRNA threonylcarbamoyladenosine biosynthesis protein TsaB
MILSIDTSTPIASVALHQNGHLLVAAQLHIAKATASSLLLLVDQALATAQINRNQLQAVAVSKGPGSYTGLRIAVSTAKGICYALGIPLIGINALHGLAAGMAQELPLTANDLLLPMIDARRMEVYAAIYTPSLETMLPTHSHILQPSSFSEYLEAGKKLWLFGDGANKVSEVIQSEQVIILNRPETASVGIGLLAWACYQAQIFEDLAYFEPFYLKEFQGNKTKGHKLLRNMKDTVPETEN